jgi:pleuromutilin/lincosamide/streptogramin A transport system ATP-binding/permease protein
VGAGGVGAGTEGLEQALKEYPGTVVIVSHDRRLVREIADRVLQLQKLLQINV